MVVLEDDEGGALVDRREITVQAGTDLPPLAVKVRRGGPHTARQPSRQAAARYQCHGG